MRRVSSRLSADWDAAASGGLDSLKRPLKGTTTYARVPAFGKAFGAASVSATLNGKPVLVDFAQGGSNGWFYAQLVPQAGTNTLMVSAVHPSGQFTNSATSKFTNNITSQTETNLSDAFGNELRKVWRTTNGMLVRQQDFTWDAFNRLVKVTERDANNNGYNWTAVFDGLSRRLRVTEQYVLTNVLSASISVVDSYYDPNVEFLEVGVSYNGRKELKVFGPDVSGSYGGAQGIGGLEAVIDVTNQKTNTVLNDRFGHLLGYAPVGQASAFQWNSARFNSYGPTVGYETPFLASGVPLVQALGWQGQRRDLTGLYYWNARPYDPVERRFLTLDPKGFLAGYFLYGLSRGDPVNFLDPTGRESWDLYSPLGDVNDPVQAQAMRQGEIEAAWYGTKLGTAAAVGYFTGGLAAGWLAPYASTSFTVIGAGIVGGVSGDLAVQGLELGAGQRQGLSMAELEVSALLGGGLNYGVNRVFAPRLLSGQMGNAEVGALGEQQAAENIVQGGGNIRAEQVQFRTPDASPRGDFVIDDPSSPSGFRVIEVKTGDAGPTYPQTWGYPHVEAGNSVPTGQNAQALGLAPGETLGPTPVDFWRYQPWELLPFDARTGAAIGGAATVAGGQPPFGGPSVQIDATGKHVKPR